MKDEPDKGGKVVFFLFIKAIIFIAGAVYFFCKIF
jgi:hypothetical protein